MALRATPEDERVTLDCKIVRFRKWHGREMADLKNGGNHPARTPAGPVSLYLSRFDLRHGIETAFGDLDLTHKVFLNLAGHRHGE